MNSLYIKFGLGIRRGSLSPHFPATSEVFGVEPDHSVEVVVVDGGVVQVHHSLKGPLGFPLPMTRLHGL